MKIITWNTAGRTKKIPEQWEHIQALNADIVCLQEVQQGGDAKWMDCLKSAYEYVLSSHDFEPNRSKTGPRKYHLIIASNVPIELDAKSSDFVPWVERLMVVKLKHLNLRIATTHIPPGVSNGWKKIEFFEGLFKLIDQHKTILTGDFNSPRYELDDGTTVTWGQRMNAKGEVKQRALINGKDGRRWHEGEYQLLRGIEQIQYKDFFRDINGNIRAYSWRATSNREIVYRFDHTIGPRELRVRSSRYDLSVLDKKLSDHALMISEVELN